MIQALKEHIVKSVGGDDRDWKIIKVNIDDIYDPSMDNISDAKLKVYVKEIKKGSIFPPIVIDENNIVIDGTHRLKAHKNAGKKKIAALVPVGKGTGKIVKDEVFEPLIKQAKYHDLDFFLPGAEPPKCLLCGALMTFVPYGLTVTSHFFPEGMPVGPYYFCGPDKIIVSKKSFIGWACVKKS